MVVGLFDMGAYDGMILDRLRDINKTLNLLLEEQRKFNKLAEAQPIVVNQKFSGPVATDRCNCERCSYYG